MSHKAVVEDLKAMARMGKSNPKEGERAQCSCLLEWGWAERCLLLQVIKMQSSEDKYVKFKSKISTGGLKLKT